MPSVRREVVLPLPRERAWELLTDQAALREWLAEDAELEPEPGGAVRADDREGVVEDVDPGRRLTFRWDDGEDASRVEWTLDEVPGGTRVTVLERRLVPDLVTWGPRLDALARASMLCPA
jgi:uncharacterized protein YndB with AHSA1/START domain